MKRISLILTCLLCFTCVEAQKVYSTKFPYQAQIKVFVVDADYKADLLVYKAPYAYEAKGNEGLWYFCPQQYQANKIIYITEKEFEAQLKIRYVKYPYQAGWRKKDKKHLME